MKYEQRYGEDFRTTPNWFNPDARISKANSLFFAIISLDSGYFPEQVAKLTEMLVSLFDDVQPDKNGSKHLEQLTYSRAGLIKNKDGKTVIAPPILIEKPKDEKSDMKDRVKVIAHTLKYGYLIDRIPQLQIKYALTGAVPKVRKDTVGKALEKISSITQALETAGQQYDGTFDNIIQKIKEEADERINPSFHDRNYLSYNNRGTNSFCRDLYKTYGIRYMPDNMLDEIAGQLATGPVDSVRITKIIRTAINRYPRPTIRFVPMDTALRVSDITRVYTTHSYKQAVKDYLSNTGTEIGQSVEKSYTSGDYTRTWHANTELTAESYAQDVLQTRLHVAEAVYDAQQAYAMYNSVQDKNVRKFLETAGYLVKDWKPEPDLWYRTAKLIPPHADDKYLIRYTDLELTPETNKGITEIAVPYADEALDRLKAKLDSDEIQDRIQKLLEGDNY